MTRIKIKYVDLKNAYYEANNIVAKTPEFIELEGEVVEEGCQHDYLNGHCPHDGCSNYRNKSELHKAAEAVRPIVERMFPEPGKEIEKVNFLDYIGLNDKGLIKLNELIEAVNTLNNK